MEKIILENPDFIFAISMGLNEDKAMEALEKQICSHPAWKSLSAVKKGHFIILPRELFHYKPNEKWDQAYAYLSKILYED